MPFEVFRRHQKKMLAVLAIMAMVAFTLDFSLFRGGRGGPGGANDPVVATLYGKPVHLSAINEMKAERSRANRLIGRLNNMPEYPLFGSLSTRAAVDALILQHEADRLGIPANVKLGKDWLKDFTGNKITSEFFDEIYRSHFSEEVTEEGLLSGLANQVRIMSVRELPGTVPITPLEVFQAYRDQYEKVSIFAVPFPVPDYVSKVGDPTEAEVAAYYEKYKSVLPDPKRDTPGFMVPRRIRAEFVRVDGSAVAKVIKAKLDEKELRAAYELRKGELPIPPVELPESLFAGDTDKKLTPRKNDPFYEVRSYLETLVSDEKAREEVDLKLGELKDDVMLPFSNKYADAVEDKKEGKSAALPPAPGDLLKAAAAKVTIEGVKLDYDLTRQPVDQEEADHLPFISSARVGVTSATDGRKFSEAMFDPRAPLYDPIDFADPFGQRYLAWKTEDTPARTPALAEIRPEVVKAWKLEKARPLAEKDANALAEQARKNGGDVKAVAGKKPVISTDAITKLLPTPGFSQFQFNAARPSEITQLPDAGEDLREAIFGLTDKKDVTVAPNLAKNTFYVVGLNQRIPVEFSRLFDTFGPYMSLKTEVRTEAALRGDRAWMTALRTEAGLPDDWKPTDETRGDVASANE